MRLRDLGRSVGNRMLESVGRASSRVQESRPLPVDVLESEDAYLVVFDAPGTTQSDVQVRYADGAVEVRIDRFRDLYPDFEMRVPGRGLSLDGRATLPADAVVEPAKANATLRANGTLEVRVPKAEAAGVDERDRDTTDPEQVDDAGPALEASDDTVEIDEDDDSVEIDGDDDTTDAN